MIHPEFIEKIKEYLNLKPEEEIVSVDIIIKRSESIRLEDGPDIAGPVVPDLEKKTRKIKKPKTNPWTGQPNKRKTTSIKLDLMVSDTSLRYAKGKLQQWKWTKRLIQDESDLWDSLKGGAIKTMDQVKKDQIINFYNQVARRLNG